MARHECYRKMLQKCEPSEAGKLDVQLGEHKTKASKVPPAQRVDQLAEESFVVHRDEIPYCACTKGIFNECKRTPDLTGTLC